MVAYRLPLRNLTDVRRTEILRAVPAIMITAFFGRCGLVVVRFDLPAWVDHLDGASGDLGGSIQKDSSTRSDSLLTRDFSLTSPSSNTPFIPPCNCSQPTGSSPRST